MGRLELRDRIVVRAVVEVGRRADLVRVVDFEELEEGHLEAIVSAQRDPAEDQTLTPDADVEWRSGSSVFDTLLE